MSNIANAEYYKSLALNMRESEKEEAVFALKQLLEYAKYLEDCGQLSYDKLVNRVKTYEESK